MESKNKIMAITTIGIILIILGAEGFILTPTITVNSVGNVQAIGIELYADQNLVTPLTQIQWGEVPVGGSTQKIGYVKCAGVDPVNLNMTLSNWNPTNASNYITCIWNREGWILSSGQFVQFTWTLNISNDIKGIKSFSFDITIKGNVYP